MAHLALALLGPFQAALNGEPVQRLSSEWRRALLAYLVVGADRPHRRETLACLLWPDRPDTIARTNLRLTLSRVRRALRDRNDARPRFLFVTSGDIQFNTASDYSLDVAEPEAFAHCSPDAAAQLVPETLCTDFLAGSAGAHGYRELTYTCENGSYINLETSLPTFRADAFHPLYVSADGMSIDATQVIDHASEGWVSTHTFHFVGVTQP